MEDPDSILPQILFILFLIVLNGFFAAAEIALVSVRRSRIRQLAEEGNASAAIVQHLLKDPTHFLSTIQIGVTFIGFLASAVGAISLAMPLAQLIERIPLAIVSGNAVPLAVFLVTLLVGFVTLVAGEIGPKSIAMQHSEFIALAVGRPIQLLSFLTFPIVALVSLTTNLLVRPFGGKVKYSVPIVTEEELKILVAAGEEEGVIEEEEKEMIHSIFEFTETIVRQIMVPRIDMRCVDIESSFDELLEVIMRYGHSRIPVYQETVDRIVGIVHAKDLLPVVGRIGEFDLRKTMRAPYFIPETKKIDELLSEFKRSKNQMAVVRDEYGGTAGLVTIEDLLEEIVGDIMDEYDIEEKMIEIVGPDHAVVSAKMSIEEMNERIDVEVEESDDYETVGGLVFSLVGRQPVVGDTVERDGYIFTVESIDNGRLNHISIRPKTKTNGDEEGVPNGHPRPSDVNLR